MADVFDQIFGQPRVRDFLRASVSADRVTHAYLFTGPCGSNKTQSAYALAAAILCDQKGCGTCEVCNRVKARKHPDVRYFAPEGAGGYLVEQIREIVADTALAPIQSHAKVYIIDRVDLLGSAAANAFLKTLEEPPEDVVLVLLGRTRESVLPTVVSRCSVVPFRHIPASEAAGILSRRTGASPELAKIAIEACGGSITRGIEFLKSNERLAFRRGVLDAMARLGAADSWDVIGMGAELVGLAKAPLDSVREAHEAQLAENADFLAKSAIRQIEARNKRELTARSMEAFRQITAITASFLRDVLAVCAGTPELVINYDARDTIEEVAARTSEPAVVRALDAVATCQDAIAYNVSPETCLDAMLFEIGEALYDPNSPR
ncbi:MAG: DNA polymerase III subunit delta [Eggerthellaceae bacterium]|nr:DNA polymerase III subunit delta [Eggerthellaceae bacterium]MBQ3329530.1 DNA polymerase III subunit delta [Eggerthellaceae bacterium]